MKIVGVDPGYAIVGVGILEYQNPRFQVLDYGAITTPAGMDFPDRLRIIYEDFIKILDMYQPNHIAIEKLFLQPIKKLRLMLRKQKELSCWRQVREMLMYLNILHYK